jgi:hypothetical protein
MRRALLAFIAFLLVTPPAASWGQSSPPGRSVPIEAMPNRPLSRTMRHVPTVDIITAPADTITANPRAFRAWLRRKIAEDLANLHAVSVELVSALDPAAPGDMRKASKQADRVVKLSHSIWSNLQMRRPTRERPKRDPSARPRDLASARADAEALRSLVREIAEAVLAEQRARDLDAERRVSMLERLERLERIGYQLKVDVEARK